MTRAMTLREDRGMATGNLPLSIGTLDHYIQAAYAVPMLEADEERELARELRDNESVESAQRLILSHLRFVIRIARDYLGYGLQLGDLIQEGNVGLMRAVRRFDPEQGVRLAAFAVHWIRAEIYEFILRNWRIVKVATTKGQRKLFFNLHRMKKRLGWFTSEQVDDIADELGVRREEVEEMEKRLSARDQLFDAASLLGDDEDEARRPHDYLADERFEPASLLSHWEEGEGRSNALQQAIATLDPRSRSIIERRWLQEPKATLHELASEYGVSAERIRQIESAAMKKMRSGLGDHR